MTKLWKPLFEYENLYEISNQGDIRSLRTGKLRKLQVNKEGYYSITLLKNKHCKTCRVHKLVMETFKPERKSFKKMYNESAGDIDKRDLVINHKDENKLNNDVDNLEWCTVTYNNNYGSLSKRRKKILQYDSQGNFIREWDCIKHASESTKIYRTNISECCRKLRKQAGGYVWEYKSSIREPN